MLDLLSTASAHDSVIGSHFQKFTHSLALEDLEHENDRLQGRFEQFREVFIADMTVITLYQSLFETFPGYGDDHAGAKLHMVEAVSSGLPTEFNVKLLMNDALDPNAHRILLLDEVQHEPFDADLA